MIKKLKFLFRAYRYRYLLDNIEIRYILDNLKTGDTVIDIGAHKGGYLYWMAKKVGPAGKVIAFEPQEILANYLKFITKKMGMNNVTIECKGVSSSPGTSKLFIPEIDKVTSPGATLNPEKVMVEKTTNMDIELIVLDDYLDQQGDLAPDLIKVDVEGHELEVFKGCRKLLKTHHPKLLFECEQRHLSDSTIHEVFELLQGLGYHGNYISQNRIYPLNQFDQVKLQDDAWGKPEYVNNFIFEEKN